MAARLALWAALPGALGFDSYRLSLPNANNVRSCTGEEAPGEACKVEPFALGHQSDEGGGALNALGKLFYAEGKEWTQALCRADTDGDGWTNGEELGDPCCCWSMGLAPHQFLHISHPADPESVPLREKELAFDGGRIAAAKQLIKGPEGGCPSECPAAPPRTGLVDDLRHFGNWLVDFSPLMLGKKLFTIGVLGFTWYMFHHGVVDVIRSQGVVWTVGMALVTMLYMDMTSGFVHLVLDNPKNLENALLADGTRSFLNHHKDPQLIVRLVLPKYFGAHHPIVFAIFLLNFIKMRSSPTIRVFGVFSLVWSHVMQMAHRWSHAPQATLPLIVRIAQQSGILIDQRYHARHHAPPHDKSFCIMMGWTDHFINHAVDNLGYHNTIFNWVLLVWLFVPVASVAAYNAWCSPKPKSHGSGEKSLAAAGRLEAGDAATQPFLDKGGGESAALGPQEGGEGAEGAAQDEAYFRGGVCSTRALSRSAVAALVVGSVVDANIGAWQRWLHPVLMSAGCVGLMTEGLVHRFSPNFNLNLNLSQQGTKSPGDDGAVHAARVAPHKKMQQAAAALVLVGFLHAVGLKWSSGLSALPDSPHAAVGCAAVAGIALQVAAGLAKHAKLVHESEKTLKWHGRLGWVVYALCLASAVLGVAQSRSASLFSYLGVYLTCACGVKLFSLKEARDGGALSWVKAQKAPAL